MCVSVCRCCIHVHVLYSIIVVCQCIQGTVNNIENFVQWNRVKMDGNVAMRIGSQKQVGTVASWELLIYIKYAPRLEKCPHWYMAYLFSYNILSSLQTALNEGSNRINWGKNYYICICISARHVHIHVIWRCMCTRPLLSPSLVKFVPNFSSPGTRLGILLCAYRIVSLAFERLIHSPTQSKMFYVHEA